MVTSQYDDIAYLYALIKYMERTYAIDETRVYIGGFSNGSAMSQVFAMTNPEIIAAVCADNTRLARTAIPFPSRSLEENAGLRLPHAGLVYLRHPRLWYPAVRAAASRYSMTFGNHTTHHLQTDPLYRQTRELWRRRGRRRGRRVLSEPRYPDRKYTTHRFFSNDSKPLNLYNYSLADGKGHDCNPEEAWLGWNYLKQFDGCRWLSCDLR